ncbi:MAG: O-antigen ligase domain-containing protein [Alphaproteobacteria bacterium]|nr:MAG: O-antigen ligase domain-containing protein [Alphaproteobacteria bacterium]
MALSGLLICAFLLGGSSRGDVAQLIILRPLAILLLGFGLWGISREQVREHRYLAILAGVFLLLPLIQLIPLPPAIWMNLPGHEIVASIDAATGLGPIWRPISLAPTATANAFFSLFVPLAILVLGFRLSSNERARLVPLLIALIAASSLLGMFQLMGARGSALYFYRVTHGDSAVGFFANRNHQAAMLACLFPLLAVFASGGGRRTKWRHWFAAAVGAVLIPAILITGSRAGMFAGLLGIVLAVGLYHRASPRGARRAGSRARSSLVYLLVAAGGLAMAGLTIWMQRAESFQRVLAFDSEQDARFRAWSPIADIAARFMPFGSGYGSFADVYKMYEPRELLHTTYFNQAHNDWLEVAMTGGVLAMLLLAVVVGLIAWRAVSLGLAMRRGSRDERLAGLGLAIMVILAFASFSDYPLRVPAIACVFVLAALWMAPHGRAAGSVADCETGSPD